MDLYFQRVEDSRKVLSLSKANGIYGCRKLLRSYFFYYNGNLYTIKEGFWWNGASIPQFAQSIVGGPWSDEVYFGALIHDILYGIQLFPRRECDEIFYEVNRKSQMSWIRAQSMDKALLTFGGFAYNNAFDKEGISKMLLINGDAYAPTI